MSRRNTEVGCYFAWGMTILNDDRPGRSVINDERSCAPYEKKYSGEKRELSVKHWDLLSCSPPRKVGPEIHCGNQAVSVGGFFHWHPSPRSFAHISSSVGWV
jgi:hypothetical protein